jgi:hypothetical protein
VLESEKIQKEKDLAVAANYSFGLGAPDCPVRQDQSRWTVRSRDSTTVYGYKSPDYPVSHPRRSRRSREAINGVRL